MTSKATPLFTTEILGASLMVANGMNYHIAKTATGEIRTA